MTSSASWRAYHKTGLLKTIQPLLYKPGCFIVYPIPTNHRNFTMSDITGGKNPNNVRGGYKAAINNPNNSDDIKDRARKDLENLDSQLDEAGIDTSGNESKNKGNFLGGHKANLHNPNTSKEAKQNSKNILEEHDALPHEDQ